jgi:acyl-CoA thioesterase-1
LQSPLGARLVYHPRSLSDGEMITGIFRIPRIQVFAAAIAALIGAATAPSTGSAAPIVIVAVGASNTSGWGVHSHQAYPAQLQALLKARGYDVEVKNAGVNFDTTNGMLTRLDAAVPDGTRVVILQPGGNDLRFFGTKARRTANIDAMVTKLRARKIKVIVYDPVFPSHHYQWDSIHINAEGHATVATNLLPQVISAIGPQRR